MRILWAVNSRQSAWVAVTRSVCTPSRVEEDLQLTALAGTNPPLFARAVGDGHFTSERLIGYEAGYRALVTSKVYMDLAAFYNQYTHLLSLEPGTPFLEASPPPAHILFPLYLSNGCLAILLDSKLLEGWYSFLHLDMTRSRSSLDASTAPITEGSSPHHQLAVQSSIELPKKLEFDQAYRHVSALPVQHVRAYSTMDSQLAWRLSRFELALVGQNLLQPNHAEFAGDPGPLVGIKRAVYGKLTWRREE